MKKILLLPLILFCVNLSAQTTLRFEASDFEKHSELKGEIISTQMLMDPGILALADSFLIVMNYNVPVFFDLLSLKTGKIVKSFGVKGRGPGELIYPFSVYYLAAERQIVVYDLTARNIVVYSLDAILSETDYLVSQVSVKDCYPSRVFPKAGKFLATLLGSEEGNSLAVLNYDGSLIKTFGHFPDVGIKYDNRIASNLFQIFGGAYKNYSLNPYGYWDRIDIYNEYDLSLILEGPNYHDLHLFSDGDEVQITSNNNLAYGKPVMGEQGFMIDYTGVSIYEEGDQTGSIFLFGYNGELFHNYSITPKITENSLEVDWDKRYIYAIVSEPEPGIVRFTF